MNLLKPLLTFAVVCFLFSGCGDPKKQIIGKWERGNEVLEFVEEGSWYAHSPDSVFGTNWGTWEITQTNKLFGIDWKNWDIVKSGKLVMGYANPPLISFDREHNFEVSNKELIIKDYDEIKQEKEKSAEQGAEEKPKEEAPKAEKGKEEKGKAEKGKHEKGKEEKKPSPDKKRHGWQEEELHAGKHKEPESAHGTPHKEEEMGAHKKDEKPHDPSVKYVFKRIVEPVVEK